MTPYPRPDFPISIERFGPQGAGEGFPVVVAVPVKDEAERIVACLASLADQAEVDFADVVVVLLLNNCRDATLDEVRAVAPQLPFRLETHSVDLPGPFANAGWARRLAMEAAAALATDDGVMLTTDADTLVDEDWIASSLREIAKGVDAVAGYVMANPMELMDLPAAILERGAVEWEYQQLAAELVARVDPELHDPWPRHNQNCGASAAISVAAYRRIGGLPPRPVGEDRALFEALRRADGKIRHSLDVHVVTSARTDGRALGGLSDAIRLRGEPDHPCDEGLEVAVTTLRRALWRAQMRMVWAAARIDPAAADCWAAKLGVSAGELRRAAKQICFGQFWHEVEAMSPRLARRLVTGAELKRELRRIRRLVEAARARARAAAAAPAKRRVAAA